MTWTAQSQRRRDHFRHALWPVRLHIGTVEHILDVAVWCQHDQFDSDAVWVSGVELYALHEGSDRLVMIEKYESRQVRSAQLKGTALADLRSALEGKLSAGLDAQVLVPHPAGDAQKGAL